MVVLHKITWKEFEKIIQILKDYKPIAMQMNHEDGAWFNRMVSLLSSVKKQPFNVEIIDLKKEDVSRIAAIVDMWNIVKNPISTEDKAPHDDESDGISNKLQRAYFKTFNEHVYPK